jgi:amino acid transporter
LCGALSFAELASSYPRSGGDYVYLTRAYGSWVGFLFAWAQLAVIRTGGSIAGVAFVFGDYARTLRDLGHLSGILYAALAIAVLTLINAWGVKPGKRVQNALTTAKVLGLAGIVLAGFCWSGSTAAVTTPAPPGLSSFAMAMVFVLFTYDGWNEAVYVTAEVQQRRRNLPLALILGTAAVTVIYLLVNAAYLAGLGFDRVRASSVVAADVLELALGEKGARVMSVLVMVSALGSINGTIFTGARIYAEMGTDHAVFSPLARWSGRWGTPVVSLLIQATISIGLVVGLGAWSKDSGHFEAVMEFTTPVFWLFFLLAGLSLFVLRVKDRDIERPFRVPGFPLVPLIFCGACAYMLYGSITYNRNKALLGLGIVLAGLPLYFLSGRLRERAAPTRL